MQGLTFRVIQHFWDMCFFLLECFCWNFRIFAPTIQFCGPACAVCVCKKTYANQCYAKTIYQINPMQNYLSDSLLLLNSSPALTPRGCTCQLTSTIFNAFTIFTILRITLTIFNATQFTIFTIYQKVKPALFTSTISNATILTIFEIFMTRSLGAPPGPDF